MVVTRSEVGRPAAAYFRPARRLPSLVTVLALGYFAVRRAAGAAHPFRAAGPSQGERRRRGAVWRLRPRPRPWPR